MNYSVLVLGASISISLFIRICCSLEANLDHLGDVTGRAEDVYERHMKFILSGVNEYDGNSGVEHVDQIFESWMQDIKTLREQVTLDRNLGPSVKMNPKQTIGPNSHFDEELCGTQDPPDLTVRGFDDPFNNACNSNKVDISEFPEGCTYHDLYMGCNNEDITNLPSCIPSTLSLFEMNQTRIEKIPGGAFPKVTINAIRLFRNTIDYIHPWAFHDVNDLTTLLIVGNKITHLAYDLYVGLDNTTTLDLQLNQISFEIYRQCPTIEPIDKIRKVLPKLRWLQFTGNPLKTIPKQMFAGLRDSPVISLYLDECSLQDIDEGAFEYFKQLEILNLSKNPELIKSSDPQNFSQVLKPLTSLRKLYLSEMGLSDFPLEALSSISEQLTILDLSKNYVYSIIDLSMLPNLQELYMDESSIQIIETSAFTQNHNLKVLSLRGNKLRQLPAYFPPTLVYLNMSNSEMPWDSPSNEPLRFHNMTKLMFLEMSKLNLGEITENTFARLPILKSAFINDCNVRYISPGSFRSITSLDVLQLNGNPISKIEAATFTGLDNLRTLVMQNCGLSFGSPPSNMSLLEDSPFKYLPNLTTLDLSKNDITYLPTNLFHHLSKLCYVHLANNPIESWESRLFSYPKVTINDDFDPNQTCFLHLNLQGANIHFVKDAMIEDFLRTSKIDLSNNDMVCDTGACKLRDLIASSQDIDNKTKQEWERSSSYKCKEQEAGKLITIMTELTNEICAIERSNPIDNVLPSSSKTTITIICVMVSLSLVTAVIIILAYKNRAHLRYFWFTVKFNVMPLSPRKAKLSTVEEDSPFSYNFDIFISYHHDDIKFIQDVFLPEIEIQKESNFNQTDVIEAKNSIYFIENDSIINNKNINKAKQKPSCPRFKVCLHERDFAVGVPITENIVDCVDRSRKTLIFVSRKYMESQWCSYELNLAYHRLVESRRKAFVLVLMEDIPVEVRSKVLNYLMVSQTYLQWPGVEAHEEEKESFWKRLRAFLQS